MPTSIYSQLFWKIFDFYHIKKLFSNEENNQDAAYK